MDSFADANWTADQHHRVEGREATSLFHSTVTEIDRSKFELRGVRHDLTMSPKAALTKRCDCLDVVVGPAGEGRFRWAGIAPEVAPDDLVVAVRTKGSKCSAPKGKARRPSIQAVDIVGGNVVVTMEELGPHRPQALGAIVPQPAPRAGLYVGPAKAKKRSIYGQSKARHGMCRILVRPKEKEGNTSK